MKCWRGDPASGGYSNTTAEKCDRRAGGAGDTRTPMLCHFAGYWVIGLPLGALLCFHYGMGARDCESD